MNILPAILTNIVASEHLTSLNVNVANDTFHLLIVESCHDALGSSMTLAFKETEVLLAKTYVPNTANTHKATIQTIEGGTVLTQIRLSYHNTTITALVPTMTFQMLDLAEHDEVFWMVSPSEISLLRDTHGI